MKPLCTIFHGRKMRMMNIFTALRDRLCDLIKIKIYSVFQLFFISVFYLQAQDYLISFTGSGATNTVTTVNVENLTQGKSQTLSGTDVLHLMGTPTGIESGLVVSDRAITIYPNPMTDHSLMEFNLPVPGKTEISLFDISGKEIIKIQEFLPIGQHTYRLQGIGSGFYVVKVRCLNYNICGRIICRGDGNVYNSITKGNQTWLDENLKTTRYNDGTSIPLVTDNAAWFALQTPGFCWYDNDDNAWYRDMWFNSSKFYRDGGGNKRSGFSVRCIKDKI